jgi:hypothetical protein
LLLLQQALFPLTRSQQADAALADDDLRPHATPKAKEIYDTLVSSSVVHTVLALLGAHCLAAAGTVPPLLCWYSAQPRKCV